MTFRWIHLYRNPETSEGSDSFVTLADALNAPPSLMAEIICNGVTLAFSAGAYWELTREGRAWVDFPEDSRPRLVNGCWVVNA